MISNFLKIIFITASLFLLGCNSDLQSKDSEKTPSINLIEQKLNEMLPESVKLVSVMETNITGYFEVNFEGIEPLYVSADGEYLISGDIYKITKEGLINKSDARRNYQRMSLLNSLDEKEFITFTPSFTKHTVYIFTDVDCGYCRQLHSQIDDYLKLGIKIHYLAYPRAGIDSDSFKKITSAWCSPNPQESLTSLKLGSLIENATCPSSPVEKHYKLGSSLGIQGTPSIITEERKLIPGYLPPQELLNQLTSNS